MLRPGEEPVSRTCVEIKTVTAGQPRPYADTVYEYVVTFSNFWDSTRGEKPGTWQPNREQALAVFRAMTKTENIPMKAERKHGLDPYIEEPAREGVAIWRIRIVYPFTD